MSTRPSGAESDRGITQGRLEILSRLGFFDREAGDESDRNEEDAGQNKDQRNPEESAEITAQDRSQDVADEEAAARNPHDPAPAGLRGIERPEGIEGRQNSPGKQTVNESQNEELGNMAHNGLG